jgi:peptide/nickel transport system substrate-binding protein
MLQAAGALMVAPAIRPALAQEPIRGGTLVAVVQPEPTVLTTTVNNTFPNGVVSVNVFDGLVAYDETLSPRPSLAESWEVTPDGLSMTFHLRRDVRWQDGVPFDSADVRYSMLEVWKKVHPRGRITFSEVLDVETPDPHTAIFRLRRPSLVILSALNAMEAQILPRHLYEGTDVLTNPHNLRPVGTGPFRFKSWKHGEFIELERNPDYWDTGKPYLDRIIFRIIPDAGARAAALEAGDVQYAPYDPVPFADFERVSKLPELAVSTKGYDWQSQYLMLEFNLRNPFLANLKVRQAIAHAIDKQGLTDTVWYGVGKPATGPIPSSLTTFYTSDVPRYDYDPKRAEALLDEAGYPRKDGGVRFAISDDYMPFNEAFQNNAEYIRQSLKRVGIEMTVRSQDLPSYLRRVYTNYDFATNTGQFSVFMDPQLGLDRQYWSKAISPGIPWTNVSGYANPEMDRIIEASMFAADPAERAALFRQMQRLAMTDLAILPLMEIEHFTVYSHRLHGLPASPDGALSSLKSVWLAPGQAG